MVREGRGALPWACLAVAMFYHLFWAVLGARAPGCAWWACTP